MEARRPILEAFFGRFPILRPVQRAEFEPIRAGNDTLIISPTGSGKTEAAVAPLVRTQNRRPMPGND
jgi:ATP-dependent Lhr-like helicase